MNDLNALGNSGANSYRANAVAFDGVNDYLSRGANLTGLLNSKSLTISCWVKFSNTGNSQTIISSRGVSETFLQIFRTSTGNLRFLGVGTNSITLLNVTTDNSVSVDEWHHVAASFDLSDSNNRFVYVDGASVGITASSYSNAVINFTAATEFLVGAAEAGTPQILADIADLWFNTEFVDLSDSAVLAKFLKNDAPVYLGSNGSRPTGTQPLLYLSVFGSASASTFAANKGSGGNLAVTGSLSDASTHPRL